jgi:prolipoprotein diacylglyceryltransferase
MGYATLRFIVEFFRGDLIRGTISGTGISVSQAIAAALIVVGALLFAGSLRRNH